MFNTLEQYKKVAIPGMKKRFGLKNDLAVPKIEKVVINVGFGAALKDSKALEVMMESVRRITGQQPIKTLAKKSIAGFDVKEGMAVGLKATLRKKRMYDFLERLINAALPRTRDFRGLARKSFDGQGNFTIGIKEHTVFPEIKADEVEKFHGLEIIISTTAPNDEQGIALLELIGFPFKKEKKKKKAE